MTRDFDRIKRLSAKTGEKFVIIDAMEGSAVVMLSLDQYEDIVEGKNQPTKGEKDVEVISSEKISKDILTEKGVLASIKREIADLKREIMDVKQGYASLEYGMVKQPRALQKNRGAIDFNIPAERVENSTEDNIPFVMPQEQEPEVVPVLGEEDLENQDQYLKEDRYYLETDD